MCGKCNGCNDCEDQLCTSSVNCFDGTFQNIVVPEGSDLNDVLALIETYIDEQTSQYDNLTITFVSETNIGLDAGTYSYAQVLNAINTFIGTLNNSITQLQSDIDTLQSQIGNNVLLYSDFPENASSGTTLQSLDDDNYELPAWYDVAVGTTYEVEADLVSSGPADDPITNGLVGFLLNQSSNLFPITAPNTPAILIPCDDEQALNVKMTLVKKNNTTAYASIVAHVAPNSMSSSPVLEYVMSDYITIATAPNTPEKLRIQVKPTTGQTLTLNRVVIKKLIPAT